MATFVQVGIRWPNLVVEYDNEKGYEFRVQLEVPIHNKEEGKAIADLLHNGSADSLGQAKAHVMRLVDPGARDEFKQIVAEAFDLNIDRISSQRQK